MIDPETLIKKTIERIKNGTLTDFSPLIALFQYERKPMTLDGHFMFLPFFSLEYPKYLTWQCGRQVSKSFTLSETLILTTGMIESFSSLYIAPRYDQLKRFHTQVLSPMLKTPGIRDFLVDRSGSDAIEMKAFLNGNTLMLEHAYSSPDRTRGASGISRCCVDESVRGTTEIGVYRLTDAQNGVYYISDRPEIVPISEVKQGDIVLSFTSDGCIYSPVVRDASYHGRRAVFRVTTQNGRVLECTADHRIHTNLGGMRLSEVIEYACNSRDGARTGTEGRNQRLCFKRDCRNVIRRRLYKTPGTHGQRQLQHTLESRTQTKRLSGVQSQYIIRARYPSSVSKSESWLRGLLGKTGNQILKDIYIACVDGISDSRLSQNHNTRAARFDDGAGRACVVVRRRRVADEEPQLREYCNQWLYRRRSEHAPQLATGAVGSNYTCAACEALEYGALRRRNLRRLSRVCCAVRVGATISSGVAGVQTEARNAELCALWEDLSGGNADPILLGGVPGGGASAKQESVCRAIHSREPRQDSATGGRLPGSSPGGDSTKGTRSTCLDDPRATGAQSAICERVCGDSPRTEKRAPTTAACSQKGRSGVRTETEGGATALLSAQKSRSGPSCTSVGSSPCCAAETRQEATRSRLPEKVSCGAPRDIPRTVPQSRGASKGAHAQRPGISGKTNSAESRALCAETRRAAGAESFSYDRIVSIEYVGEDDVYDIEVVGTHNYILANGMCSYNCQDINPDFLPVFESTTDASRFGVIQATGTPKTTDTLLELQFSKSSQCHWAIKCAHCAKWNIADIDEQLIGMIGKEGLSCAYCGKILDPRTGGWLPKFPDRLKMHAGYHVPQIILPMHCENPTKWRVLRARQTEWDKTKFFNEILGVASDSSIKLLTKDDLLKSAHGWENTIQSAAQHREMFDTVFLGVDWSGGGGGFSRTAVAVLARSTHFRETYVLYMTTFPHGLTPEEEVDKVAQIYSTVKADMIAHDYTGAGFVRESVLLGRHPYLRDKIYPFAYVFRTGSQLVSYSTSGSRTSANVDKTRSLLLTFNSIRSGLMKLPKFSITDNNAPQLELLNIVERPQEFGKSSIKEVYLLQRAPGRYDDAAHAVNIAYIAMCDLTEDWPNFSVDPKYEMTDAALMEITGQHGETSAI